jgi:hypothetical protein
LPDDYLRKMKQDLAEVEAQVESKTRYVPDPDAPPPADDDTQSALLPSPPTLESSQCWSIKPTRLWRRTTT